jgi:hypothetical protein
VTVERAAATPGHRVPAIPGHAGRGVPADLGLHRRAAAAPQAVGPLVRNIAAEAERLAELMGLPSLPA